MAPAQRLGHLECDGILEHELSTQTDGLRERSVSGGKAEELFFKGLAGSWRFMDVLRFLFGRRTWSLRQVGFYRKPRTSPVSQADAHNFA